MQKIKVVLSIYIALFFTSAATAAVLVDSSGQTTTSIIDQASEFKSQSKMGFGLSAAGTAGLLAANMELNFTPQTSLLTGFGFASNYQSFNLQFKRSLGGHWFSSYVSAGYARWYTTSKEGSLDETSPSFLADRFLSGREKAEGKFSKNFIYPGFGFQYLQLQGEMQGMSLFVEVMMLLEVSSFKTAATGGLGMMYYF